MCACHAFEQGSTQTAFEGAAGDIGLVGNRVDDGALDIQTVMHIFAAGFTIGYLTDALFIFVFQCPAYGHGLVGAVGKGLGVFVEITLDAVDFSRLGGFLQFTTLLRI